MEMIIVYLWGQNIRKFMQNRGEGIMVGLSVFITY